MSISVEELLKVLKEQGIDLSSLTAEARKSRKPLFKEGDTVWILSWQLRDDKVGQIIQVPKQVKITAVHKEAKRISYEVDDRSNRVDEYYIRATREELEELIEELE